MFETTNVNLSGISPFLVVLRYRYLDACTALTHTVLKLLEQFSQDRRLYIRSKRQKLRNKQDDQGGESESEDERTVTRKVAEKAFQFSAFESVRIHDLPEANI